MQKMMDVLSVCGDLQKAQPLHYFASVPAEVDAKNIRNCCSWHTGEPCARGSEKSFCGWQCEWRSHRWCRRTGIHFGPSKRLSLHSFGTVKPNRNELTSHASSDSVPMTCMFLSPNVNIQHPSACCGHQTTGFERVAVELLLHKS